MDQVERSGTSKPFFASERVSFTTGEVIDVYGGKDLRSIDWQAGWAC
ncbi:MAG: hypothetical protein ACOCY7_02130 [Halodesulfurarchaeum sp.]